MNILTENGIKGKYAFAALALIAIMVAGSVAIFQPSTMQAQAATSPYFSVEPATYHAIAVNEIFTVNIVVNNIDALSNFVGFEFKLGYNTTLLQVLSVSNGTFLEGFAGAPNGGVFYLGPIYGANYVQFGGLILPDGNGVWHAPFPSGNGTVAKIQFKGIYEPLIGQASCDLKLYDTKLADPTGHLIAQGSAVNGYYFIIGRPYLSVEPSAYHAIAVNEIFTVNIVVNNIDALSNFVGFEFKLGYNTTLLQVLSVSNGTFLEGFAGAPNRGVFYFAPVYGANYVLFGGYILPDDNGVWHAPFPSGSGTVAKIQFKGIYEPPVGQTASCDLKLYDVKLADNVAHVFSNRAISGLYDISRASFLSVEPSAYHAIAVNEIFTVNIVVNNIDALSNFVGFEFKLGYNTTLLQVLSVSNGTFLEGFAGAPNRGVFYFAPVYGANYVLFGGYILPDDNGVWHAPFPSGSGTVAKIQFKGIYEPPVGQTASCDLKLYDVKLADNVAHVFSKAAASGLYDISHALPSLVGDLNSDGVVDIFDALLLAKAFGTSPGDALWNVLADINNDGQVDIFDAILLGSHFGK